MRKHVILATLSAALILAAVIALDGLRQTTATSPPTVSGEMDRTSLPIPEPDYPHATELDARDATGAAAVRGEGADRRAQRDRLSDRRHRLRPVAAPSAGRSHADARAAGEGRD